MIRRPEPTSILWIWLWRIWWNIYATHIKYWSLNWKPRSCTPAARFGITSAGDQMNSPVFVFQHFYKGLCMCSCHVEELSSEETQSFWESEEMFWVTVVKVCACRPGQQQRFPAGGELVQLLDVCSFHPQSKPQPRDFSVDWTGAETRPPACGPQEQKGLALWGGSEWVTEKNEKKKMCK